MTTSLKDDIATALEKKGVPVQRTKDGGIRVNAKDLPAETTLVDTPEAKRPPRKIGSKLANTTGAQLRSFIERIERLEEEKAVLGADIREVYAEAKANGYDPKIMRMVVRLRKLDANVRAEQEALLDTYLAVLGMVQ